MSNDNITIYLKNSGDDNAEERIDAYLRDELTADEEADFRKELDADSELRQKAVARARIVFAMEEEGNKADAEIIGAFRQTTYESVIKIIRKHWWEEQNVFDYRISIGQMEEEEYRDEMKQEIPEHVDTSIQKKPRIIPLRILSVACSIIAIVWLGYLSYGRYSTQKLADEYATVIDNETDIMRGGTESDKVTKELKTLFAEVSSGDNIEANIPKLEKLWAVSLSPQYNDYTDYSPEIGWHLAIAYLKDNDRKKAANVLHKLIETTEKGSLINRKAKELLEKIE